MSLRSILERHELVVCFGTGGVGKTTIAAALALAAAELGRRAAVLTIDPARALARAFGLPRLGSTPESISSAALDRAGLTIRGSLDAAMLDQKSAWDAFIRRHARDPDRQRAILENAFYRELSTRFAGSTEYVAIEQLCLLHESGRYDLIVLDTPAAAHALDFARAPERIDRMLDPAVARWLGSEHVGSSWRTVEGAARRIVRRLERATGRETMASLSGLFQSISGMLDDIRQRSQAARGLLWSDRSAFLLVTSPRQQVLAQADSLRVALRQLDVPLRGVVFNRTHPLPAPLSAPDTSPSIDALLAALPVTPAARAWLERTIESARDIDAAERRVIAGFLESELSAATHSVSVPELDRDLHSLADLHDVARQLIGER